MGWLLGMGLGLGGGPLIALISLIGGRRNAEGGEGCFTSGGVSGFGGGGVRCSVLLELVFICLVGVWLGRDGGGWWGFWFWGVGGGG